MINLVCNPASYTLIRTLHTIDEWLPINLRAREMQQHVGRTLIYIEIYLDSYTAVDSGLTMHKLSLRAFLASPPKEEQDHAN
jgi:hypothetical protein